jgi:hypothetical protein
MVSFHAASSKWYSRESTSAATPARLPPGIGHRKEMTIQEEARFVCGKFAAGAADGTG